MLTFELKGAGTQLEIHGDEAGLAELVVVLQRLLKTGHVGHDHLATPSWGGNELSENVQGPQNVIVNAVTIHLWPT